MPVAKRTRASKPKTYTEVQMSESEEDNFETIIYERPAESDQDSDHSDYGRKRKKRAKRSKPIHHKPGPAPKAPAISDNEYDDAEGESFELGEMPVIQTPQQASSDAMRKGAKISKNTAVSQTLPNILQIQLHRTENGATTINLDLAGILLDHSTRQEGNFNASLKRGIRAVESTFEDSHITLVDTDDSPSVSSSKVTKKATSKKGFRPKQERAGFLDLPYEIRVRVYRQVFVTESPIDFSSREDFLRSSGFLRTCRVVHEEGRAVLYGENAFHFQRTSALRGHFFERIWKEIGFKDIRRFLDTIGGENISCMKYVSFLLYDAAPSFTPYLEDEERRFVNDPVLFYIFNLLGSWATFSKVAFTFGGRRAISTPDFHFLKAITGIKCYEFIHATTSDGHASRVISGLAEKMQKMMVVPRADEDEVDLKRKKQPTVRMWQDRPGRYTYTGW